MCILNEKKTSVSEFSRSENLLQDLLDEQERLKGLDKETEGKKPNPAAVEDWALTQIKAEDTCVRSLQDELKRLQVLKSYNVAGVEGIDSVDRLTKMAASIFDMPICVVSLVDLRQLWFLSTQGLGDLRSIPRKDTLCSHAVCNMHDILVVPDCTKDFRFEELFTVTGEPHLRFYAGACIKSKEGYNIGNFCVLDTKPHPEGISEMQTKLLQDFAATTMQLLEDRRYRQEVETKHKPMISNAAHELLTPMAGMKLSLSVLQEDRELSSMLHAEQKEMLSLAGNCSDLMERICRNVIDDGRKGTSTTSWGSGNDWCKENKHVMTADLVKSIDQVVRPIAKRVPVLFQVDPASATVAVSQDLAVFRVALSFLSVACARTRQGSVVFKVYLKDDGARNDCSLMFECQDTADPLNLDDQRALFSAPTSDVPAGSNLSDERLMGYSRAASLLDSFGGAYGYRPKAGSDQRNVFWFSIPKQMIKANMPLAELQPTTKPISSIPVGLPIKPIRADFQGFDRKSNKTPAARFTRKQGQGLLPLMLGATLLSPSLFDGKRGSSLPSLVEDTRPNAYCDLEARRNESFRTSQQKLSTEMLLSRIASKRVPNSATDPKQVLGSLCAPRPIESNRDEAQPWKKEALVVDDSLVVRKTLSRFLTKSGYKVTAVENGKAGLDEMKKKMFDFVLLDYLMPVMDGLDCVKQFRDWEALHRPSFYQCIFGISAHAGTADLQKGVDAGMDKYYSKPVPAKILKELSDSASKLRLTNQTSLCAQKGTNGPVEAQVQLNTGFGPIAPSSFSAKRKKSCLVASSTQESITTKALQEEGWECVRVNSSTDALRSLKERNWDAVVVDGKLAPLDGVETIATFREWEKGNRINRQSNVFLESCLRNEEASFDSGLSIQAPAGFDAVIRSESPTEDFRSHVKTAGGNGRCYGGLGSTLSIITH